MIGADRAAPAVQLATARAQARGARNVKFVEADPTEMQFDRPFDAVVGRLVLMYYPDPVAAVRKLVAHLRDEGLMVFQEFDMTNFRSLPPAPIFDRHAELIRQTLRATSARTELGMELYPVFLAAGLPGPSMRMDAVVGGGPESPAYEIVTEVVRSLLPVMEKLNIANARELDIPTRMRDEVVAAHGVTVTPALIGAWSRAQRQCFQEK